MRHPCLVSQATSDHFSDMRAPHARGVGARLEHILFVLACLRARKQRNVIVAERTRRVPALQLAGAKCVEGRHDRAAAEDLFKEVGNIIHAKWNAHTGRRTFAGERRICRRDVALAGGRARVLHGVVRVGRWRRIARLCHI